MTTDNNTIQRRCRQLILLSLLIGLAACDRTTPIMSSSSAKQAGGQSPQASSAFTQFPDIPIPSGADVNVDKTLIFGSKPWFGQLSLSASAKADVLFDFYRNNLPQYQWRELTSVRAPTSILTYESDDRILAIAIQGATLRNSQITLTVSPKGNSSTRPQGGLMPAPVQTLQ